jgi:hypothetical protein
MRKIKMFSAGLVALALVAGFDGQAQQPSPTPAGGPPGSDRLGSPNGFPTAGTGNLAYLSKTFPPVEVMSDRRVKIRIYAPAAQKVEITGEITPPVDPLRWRLFKHHSAPWHCPQLPLAVNGQRYTSMDSSRR